MTAELNKEEGKEEEKTSDESEKAPSEENKQESGDSSEGEADALKERIAKLEEERDNYKQGLLDSKEKLKYALDEDKEGEESEENLREIVGEVVSEQIEGLARENEELREALTSKRSMTKDHVGSNQDKGEEKPEPELSGEDRRFLRAWGKDPDKWADENSQIGRQERPDVAD